MGGETETARNTWRLFFFPHGVTARNGPVPPHYRGFTITLTHTTIGRTPPDEWSARRRDLYLTTHNTRKRQTSMPLAGFELTITASERPQTHGLDCAAAGIGTWRCYPGNFLDRLRKTRADGMPSELDRQTCSMHDDDKTRYPENVDSTNHSRSFDVDGKMTLGVQSDNVRCQDVVLYCRTEDASVERVQIETT
jgi:hypothetical protein